MNTEKVYKVMDSALEQYRLDKSDLNFGRAQGAAKLALELFLSLLINLLFTWNL